MQPAKLETKSPNSKENKQFDYFELFTWNNCFLLYSCRKNNQGKTGIYK